MATDDGRRSPPPQRHATHDRGALSVAHPSIVAAVERTGTARSEIRQRERRPAGHVPRPVRRGGADR